MTVILIDTNIICAAPTMQSSAWQSLAGKSVHWDLTILVPEVVVMEAVNVIGRDLKEFRSALPRLPFKKFDLREGLESNLAEIDSRIDTVEERLLGRLDELGVEIFETPSADHMEIARRASVGQRPYSHKSKDGYRDTLIWMTILAVADKYPLERIWFVSDNTNDFGEPAASRQSCPFPFHSELLAELTERGISDRVRYAVSITALEAHLAKENSPLSDRELEKYIRSIDFEMLDDALLQAIRNLPISPDIIGFSETLGSGRVMDAKRSRSEDWRFADGARRESGGWTASFSVRKDAAIDLPYLELAFIQIPKEIDVSGVLEFYGTGQLNKFSITSLEGVHGNGDLSRDGIIRNLTKLIRNASDGKDWSKFRISIVEELSEASEGLDRTTGLSEPPITPEKE
ncbi:PIN domain-containing protein [Nocardia sp. CA-120079]|uniref:PIN domain-containing protein n=1 Tax=Nocardia sp. CA-120079 TaxID=3239974 RepID=UPI003D970379